MTWCDSASAEGGWHEVPEGGYDTEGVVTVGRWYGMTPHVLTVVLSFDAATGYVNGGITIPLVCVTKVEVLATVRVLEDLTASAGFGTLPVT